MAELLGDNILPDSVASRRQNLRDRVQGLREPVRNFRERTVPGPDLVGKAENKLVDLRNRAVSRDSVLSRIRARRSDSGSDGGDGSSSSGNNSGAMT